MFAAMLAAVPAPAPGQASATVSIQAGLAGAVVSSNLFGIFFEEINFAGEGGIYAEMVRDRAFYNPANADYWTFVSQGSAAGSMNVDTTQPLNTNIVNSLKLTMSSGSGSVGAANSGFWGMSLTAGAVYNLSFHAMSANGFSGPIVAQLQNAAGTVVYSQASFSGLAGNWQEYSAALVSSGTDTNAQLVLTISRPGTVWLDVVSLFPQATYNHRTNGLRSDLAGLLQTLGPSFLRYPGGNFIEANNLTNAVRWKKTIGDISQRPGHLNDAWGYWSTDGYGLDEAFAQCQDMGMQLLYGINAGLSLGYNGSTNNTVSLDEMGPWVQDSLDLIQYANGDTNTTWGALRAANGHPAPYNLQYLEIGNENGGSYYNDRYAMFYSAIKSNYPSMHLLVPDWGGIPTATPVEIQDEHYYSDPATFISYATKYDGYSRSGPKVFVGEYAVTSGYGTYGNLSAALGEASFMTGMERNSDVVEMASYAPLFGNVNDMQWQPDLIYYNNSKAFGTPSYYVQQMFSRNRGDYVLPVSVTTSNSSSYTPHGAIGVGSWNTSVQYTNILVTSNGVTLYQSDFVGQGAGGWNVFNGAWSASNGVYQQTAQITDCYSIRTNAASTNWANYTITLQAMKTGGAEGFLVLFNALDNYDWTWWNIGGWSDTEDGIEQMTGGIKTTYMGGSQYIAPNTWYYIRIVVTGARAQCYLGTNAAQAATNLVEDVTLPPAQAGLLASATYSKSAGAVIVKAVNPYTVPLSTTFNLAGVNNIAPAATVIQLTSGSAMDENSFANPAYVSPITNTITGAGTNFTLNLPANSLSILRLTASGINNYSNLVLQVPSPITNGVAVASTVLARQDGNWVNLTANTNHAIVWISANTNVATVDINGNVSGVASGITSIIASYAALGLSATQTVQVIYAPAVLAHRYSFNETNGSMTVADSVGGPAWNGTLPNGGAFSNGKLTFSSSAQQYLNLPGDILSNDTAATVEMWIPGISGAATSPPFVYLFAFGNTDGGGNGSDYIFFNPNLARAVISGADPGYHGEQGGDLASSLGLATDLHLTCVFDPPDDVINIYTNGVLASTFTGITDPLSTVGNEFSYIGRSLYTDDAYLDWTLQELRIYNGALQPADVAATDVLGPGQILSTNAPGMTPEIYGGTLTLSWPVASSGFSVDATTNLASGVWSPLPVAPQLVGGQWQVNIPVSGGQQFYRLRK
jgi:alpha-L-arabinofuranosidase